MASPSGLAVSVGGLAPLIGALADATTLRTVLAPLILLPALGGLLLRSLHEPEPLGTATGRGADTPAGHRAVNERQI